jgi:hypothetical protein
MFFPNRSARRDPSCAPGWQGVKGARLDICPTASVSLPFNVFIRNIATQARPPSRSRFATLPSHALNRLIETLVPEGLVLIDRQSQFADHRRDDTGISDGRRLAVLCRSHQGKGNPSEGLTAATFVRGRWLDSLSNDNVPDPPPSWPQGGRIRYNHAVSRYVSACISEDLYRLSHSAPVRR